MKLFWEDGEEREYKLGSILKGLRVNTRRPTKIEISDHEIIGSSLSPEKVKKYIHTYVIPCMEAPVVGIRSSTSDNLLFVTSEKPS